MQNRQGLIFLGLALVMGIAAAWATQQFVTTSSGPEGEVQTTPVVVTRVSVPVATSLTKDQLVTVDWPVDHLPPGALKDVDLAVGRVVRRPLPQDEPVLQSALFEEGASGGLLAVIAPERRAVTVKVDNVIGVAGFVTPGARVDVMATLRRVDWKKVLPYTQVILQNIRVLAADQKLEEVKAGSPEVVSVVTLEVDPVQAEYLVYAAHEGRLHLALRSPGDNETVSTRSVGVADVLGDKRVTKTRTRRVATQVQVINGSRLDTKRF